MNYKGVTWQQEPDKVTYLIQNVNKEQTGAASKENEKKRQIKGVGKRHRLFKQRPEIYSGIFAGKTQDKKYVDIYCGGAVGLGIHKFQAESLRCNH